MLANIASAFSQDVVTVCIVLQNKEAAVFLLFTYVIAEWFSNFFQ